MTARSGRSSAACGSTPEPCPGDGPKHRPSPRMRAERPLREQHGDEERADRQAEDQRRQCPNRQRPAEEERRPRNVGFGRVAPGGLGPAAKGRGSGRRRKRTFGGLHRRRVSDGGHQVPPLETGAGNARSVRSGVEGVGLRQPEGHAPTIQVIRTSVDSVKQRRALRPSARCRVSPRRARSPPPGGRCPGWRRGAPAGWPAPADPRR